MSESNHENVGGMLTEKRHLLSVSDLNIFEVRYLLERAKDFLPAGDKSKPGDQTEPPRTSSRTLAGRTLINLFFENSTRTQSSFEIAAKRLGADVINMSPRQSSISKGETLLDTAATLNAMGPDLLVIRHASSGAALLLSRKVDCAVINAGDGRHEHPSQALLDALTLETHLGSVEGLQIAICGDVLHSRVARSNINLLTLLGARVRVVGPPTLIPKEAEDWGAEIHHDMRAGLTGVDVIMMLRLQLERMEGGYIPSQREYFRFYGLDRDKLSWAKPDVKIMHPGPMNRGVEIDSTVADLEGTSLIQSQVAMGVAMRMAILEKMASHRIAKINPDRGGRD